MTYTVEGLMSNTNNFACGFADAIIDIANYLGDDITEKSHTRDMVKVLRDSIDYTIGSPEMDWNEIENSFTHKRKVLYETQQGRMAGYIYTMRIIRNMVNLLSTVF